MPKQSYIQITLSIKEDFTIFNIPKIIFLTKKLNRYRAYGHVEKYLMYNIHIALFPKDRIYRIVHQNYGNSDLGFANQEALTMTARCERTTKY